MRYSLPKVAPSDWALLLPIIKKRRSHWPWGLRRGSEAARLLGQSVRIPRVSWTSVSFECCMFSGTDLCVGIFTRPDESYRLWLCVTECNFEALKVIGPGPQWAVGPWKNV